MRPDFTLMVVTSADGFIASHESHQPSDWASPEEQAQFLAEVEAADWAIMGRRTHEVADREDRRRIVFSTSAIAPEWRRPNQLWLDPSAHSPDDFAALVAPVRELGRGLILGGTMVHDWFHSAGRVDRVLLTIEPVSFGGGLPVFSGLTGPADEVFTRLGYRLSEEKTLNALGTRLLTYL